MPALVQRFEQNLFGRDFVVGDVHGSFSLIYAALRQVSFDFTRDRLFLVGDLIDRGPDSAHVAEFLQLPNVFSARGNHEDMLLELYREGEPSEAALNYVCRQNGMNWWLATDPETRLKVLAELEKLPLVLEIATARGTVGVLHADVPAGMNWADFLFAIECKDPFATHACLWGRDRIRFNDRCGVEGVGRIFVGHTPQLNGIRKFGNIYAIDSAAVFGLLGSADGNLSMVALTLSTQRLVGPRVQPWFPGPLQHPLVDVRLEKAPRLDSFGSSGIYFH